MTTSPPLRLLETFVFDAKEPPYCFIGEWGCCYRFCSHGNKVRVGQKVHKIEQGGDVDLIHPDCLEAMRKKLAGGEA